MTRSILPLLVLLFFCWPQSGQAAGEVNKCIDPNGKVTYSSQPCPDDSVRETVRIRNNRSSDAGNAGNEDGKGEPGSMQELDRRIEAASDNPVLKAQLELTRQQCQLAKTQLERYANAPYLVRQDEQGNQVRLSDEEAAAEKARLRSYLAQECR